MNLLQVLPLNKERKFKSTISASLEGFHLINEVSFQAYPVLPQSQALKALATVCQVYLPSALGTNRITGLFKVVLCNISRYRGEEVEKNFFFTKINIHCRYFYLHPVSGCTASF